MIGFLPLAHAAPADITVYYDGVLDDAGTKPILRNGRTLVPLREIFDRLGAVVYYSPSDKRILAWRAESDVELQVNSREAKVNGQTVMLDSPPIIHQSDRGAVTMVPARFISDALKAGVKYDGSVNQVHIDTTTMGFFDEVAPFNAGDEVLTLYRREWHPATIMSVIDHDDKEDKYLIRFVEPSGRVITPNVGRRYIRRKG